jgi:hypothetical protein
MLGERDHMESRGVVLPFHDLANEASRERKRE